MYHNGKPPIPASSLPTGHVDLRDGEPPMVVCGDCGQWVIVKRTIAFWHTADGADCPGGGQRYRLDVSPIALAAGYGDAVRDAAQHRPRRMLVKAAPPIPVPVADIARARPVRPAQTGGHRAMTLARLDALAKRPTEAQVKHRRAA